MTDISTCQQQLFWSLLHRSAGMVNTISSEEKTILISSELFEDVTIQGDGWSPSLTQCIYQNFDSSFERLSHVLHGLAVLGYRVTVLTESSTWKWSVQGSNERVDAEFRFLKSLLPIPNIFVLSHLKFHNQFYRLHLESSKSTHHLQRTDSLGVPIKILNFSHLQWLRNSQSLSQSII